MLESGRLTITDRKKDVIIRGGENISSSEVEAVLARHDAIAEAAVVAVPDDRYGERVGAFVILRPGASIALHHVQELFRSTGIARQKTPEHLFVVDEFPRTAAGKVKKHELRSSLSRASDGSDQ
jgi:acyl-CoA synthetase (AMP-forming)/AMP-acid ligase II